MTLQQLSKTVDFVQATTPSNANDGETFLDTSQSPPRLKVFDESANAFVSPQSTQNLDAPVSQAGASAEVKRHDLRFIREMSRLFFDRSLADLNFSEGIFEIFADTNNISTSSTVLVETGTNGRALISSLFDIGTANFTGTTLNAQDNDPAGFAFSADGTTMIEVGDGSDQFYEYSLNTGFDIGTANFTGTTLNTQSGLPSGVAFSADGTTMIESGFRDNEFFQYSLDTAFDIGTADFTGTTLFAQDSSTRGVTFSADGTTMIEVGDGSNQFYEYSLDTGFDIGTANFTGTTLNAQDTRPNSITFSADGTTMVEAGFSADQFFEYSLNTPFDISTANFTGTTLNAQSDISTGVNFSADGSTMVELGDGSNLFYEYKASSGIIGTGTVSKSVTLGFTPTTAVVEDTTENGLNASYDITDGNGNTLSVSQSEVGTTVDCSALTDGSLTVTANLDNPTTGENALRDFAVYFD